MQLLLTSIHHCNICLSTITPMLQHTGMEVFDHSSQSRISYTISDIGYHKKYPIPDIIFFLKLSDMNPILIPIPILVL